MTQRDKWNPTKAALKYWAFKDEVIRKRVFLPLRGAHITFNIPMYKSWSEKKKQQMDGRPHEEPQKNDLDNLIKGLGDALYRDDSAISQY